MQSQLQQMTSPVAVQNPGDGGYLNAVGNTGYNQPLPSDLTPYLLKTLQSGHIFVGSAGNIATDVALSGDASLSSAGILGINKTRLNVRNETGVTIASTRAVYVSGFNNRPLILLADNTDEAKHDVIGITIAPIAHQANGFIATSGQCDAETNSWTVGTELYVGTAGVLTSTKPTSGEVRHAGIVTAQANYPAGKILLYNAAEGDIRGVGAGAGILDRLGDSVGATKWSLRSYANAEVASINSLGDLSAGGGTFSRAVTMGALVASTGKFTGNVGFNNTAPIAKPTLNAAATDPATTMALVNQIRAALISYGLCN